VYVVQCVRPRPPGAPGDPAVGIATTPFADEAIEQARLLAMPDCRVLYIPHPIQLLTPGELAGRAEAILPAVVGALTQADPRIG
jgi:hypothetical protein